MRPGIAAAALAALVFAAPAAAQTNAVEVVRGAMEQMVRNSEGVNDYTLVLSTGPVKAPVYVYRDGDEWTVATPEDDPMAGLFGGLVVWPSFHDLTGDLPAEGELSDEEVEALGEYFTLTRDTVAGRPVHAVFANVGAMTMESGGPDSVYLFVDPATRQLMRVRVAASADAMEQDFAPAGGRVRVTMDFGDYRETDGLTVPRRLRMDMSMELDLDEDQREMMRSAVAAARAELENDDSLESRQTAAMIDLFLGLITEGRMEIPVTVDQVRVNAGPPDWFEGD
jgi:hypothetical protein